MNFAHCLHIVLVIGKHTDVLGGYFSDGVGGGSASWFTWEYLSMEAYIMDEENFHERVAGFSSIKKKTLRN